MSFSSSIQIGTDQSDFGLQEPNIYEVAIDAAKGSAFNNHQDGNKQQKPHHYEVTSINNTNNNERSPKSHLSNQQQNKQQHHPHHYEVTNIHKAINDMNLKQSQANLYEDVNHTTTLTRNKNQNFRPTNNGFDNGGYQTPDQEEPIYYETEPSPVEVRRQINMYYDASQAGIHGNSPENNADVHINDIYE